MPICGVLGVNKDERIWQNNTENGIVLPMTYYDDIYEFAVDNHYLISTDDAAEIGVPTVELAKLAYRGKLENLSRGLYRLTRWVPSESYPYAEAVARVGEGAYLCGESVIALLGLAPTNPAYMQVAVQKRTRRKLPVHIRLKKGNADDRLTTYNGVQCQHVSRAIPAAASSMPDDRLRDAAQRAYELGFLLREDYKQLKREMRWEQKGQIAKET